MKAFIDWILTRLNMNTKKGLAGRTRDRNRENKFFYNLICISTENSQSIVRDLVLYKISIFLT